MTDTRDFDELVTYYIDHTLTDDELAALNEALASDAALRRRFQIACLIATRIGEPAHADKLKDASSGGIRATSEISNFKFSIFNLQSLSLAAALLAACGLAAYFLVFNADPSDIEHRPSHIEHPPLATLIEATPGSHLTTPSGFISEGHDYPRGEYSLDKGTAEFMLTNAVNVKLRGDTRMVMRNDMNVTLTRGSANFVVPTDATGFTVHLPDGSRVVDLGTAFSVDVADDRISRVRVTQGDVRIDLADAAGAERSVLLAAGRAAYLTHDADHGPELARIIDAPRPVTGVTATASSELAERFDRVATHTVDGNGLDPETGYHTGIPDAAMWLSRGIGFPDAKGDDRHPAITFDLGGSYLLDSLRVWNYNEVTGRNLFRRGIKDARILVSADGESFTPLTDTSDRDAVFSFDVATGRSDTDFSQTITLVHEAPVRFVRIEAITTHDGSDFDTGRIADEGFAGLSEVRFTGTAIDELNQQSRGD